MKGFHERFRAMTIRQLGLQPKGKGSPTTLTRVSERTFNPKTGRYEGGVETTYSGSAVRVNYSERSYKDVNVQYGDFQIYLSPVQVDGVDHPMPENTEVIEFLGKTCHIIRVEPFNDNGFDCGWKLQVRYG